MMSMKLPTEAKTALKTFQALTEDIRGIRTALERLVELQEQKS